MRNGTTRVRHRTMAEFTSARSGTGSLADPLSPMDRWAEPSIITRIFSETVGPRPCLTEPPAPVGTSHLVFSCSGIAAASGGQRPPTKEWRAVAGEPRRPPAPSGALRCPASPPQLAAACVGHYAAHVWNPFGNCRRRPDRERRHFSLAPDVVVRDRTDHGTNSTYAIWGRARGAGTLHPGSRPRT
jgi:hypothetical protein